MRPNTARAGRALLGLSALLSIVSLAACEYDAPPRERIAYAPQVVYAPAPAPAPAPRGAPQPVVYPQGQATMAPPPAPTQEALAPAADETELQQLVAAIALYPDPLLATVLTASTFPGQVQAASQWLAGFPTPTEADIQAQAWDPSVKALVHYPTVLRYMAGNIGWTQSLGAAVASEQPLVMAAVQDLRAQALAVGSLRSTSQQTVLQEDSTIAILPANPGVIYVPAYDPAIVYVEPAPIVFGIGLGIGAWLDCGVDWHRHALIVGGWHDGWAYRGGGWRHAPLSAYPAWHRDGRWGSVTRVAPRHYVTHPDFRGRAFRPAPVYHPVPGSRYVGRGPAAGHVGGTFRGNGGFHSGDGRYGGDGRGGDGRGGDGRGAGRR